MKVKRRNACAMFPRIMSLLLVGILLPVVAGCAPPNSAQTGDSGWVAKRYILFNKAWGSISSTSQVDALDSTERTIVLGGYVTTDSNGQAQMRRPSQPGCTIYVFQDTSLQGSPESISTCPKGTSCPSNATFHVENCKIALSTLPATITFAGTEVTIIENRDLETVIVLTSEGTAIVTPVDTTIPPFEVSALSAAYVATPERREQALNFFGINPGQPVGFDQFVTPILNLGLTRQIQSTNLILQGQSLPIVPLPAPFSLGLRWLAGQPADFRVAQAFSQSVDWNTSLQGPFAGSPLLFDSQTQVLDVRSAPFDPANAKVLMDQAGYSSDQPLTIAFDETVPGLGDVAAAMARQLEANVGLIVNVQPFNPESAEGVFADLTSKQLPVLVLGGF